MWFMQYKNTINIYVVYAMQKYNKYICGLCNTKIQ